jgi:hypothetical protein
VVSTVPLGRRDSPKRGCWWNHGGVGAAVVSIMSTQMRGLVVPTVEDGLIAFCLRTDAPRRTAFAT